MVVVPPVLSIAHLRALQQLVCLEDRLDGHRSRGTEARGHAGGIRLYWKGNASFSGPHVAVGNLRVSQTECPPGYATRITNIAKSPLCPSGTLALEFDGRHAVWR